MTLKYKLLRKMDELIIDRRLGISFAIAIPLVSLLLSLFFQSNMEAIKSVKLPISVPRIQIGILSRKSSEKEVEKPKEETPSVFADELKPIYGDPVRLHSQAINMDMKVHDVSITVDGYMETPKEWNQGGWYDRSSRPGEKGNLVINAHYDDNYGRPAAFWQLKNLKVGDKVAVVDDLGRTYNYKVVESLLLDINDPNRLEILKDEDGRATMTLITCGGVWLPGRSIYDKRSVIKAELV